MKTPKEKLQKIISEMVKTEVDKQMLREAELDRSMDAISIIKYSISTGKNIQVTFYPAWNSVQKDFSPEFISRNEKLVSSLKVPKVSIFEIPDELADVLALLKSDDVQKLEWV